MQSNAAERLSRGYSSTTRPLGTHEIDKSTILVGKLRINQLRAQERRRRLSVAKPGYAALKAQMLYLPISPPPNEPPNVQFG
jgi:hypothetical protein